MAIVRQTFIIHMNFRVDYLTVVWTVLWSVRWKGTAVDFVMILKDIVQVFDIERDFCFMLKIILWLSRQFGKPFNILVKKVSI